METAAVAACESERNRNSDSANYRGVRKRKWGKWVSEIRLPNSRERIWLGSYDSPEKAARAFDAALFCLRGNNTNFNFPNEPPNIPGGRDLHPSQIRAVAARFANTYISPSSSSSSSSSSHELHQDPQVSDMTSTSMEVACDHTNNIPDYGIFPGFDDYFMPLQPPLTVDYGDEQVYDGGVYSEDPSFLWSF